MSRCQGPEPPASPAAEENDRMWRSDGGGETLQPARRCVYADSDAGINFIMSSATAYSSSSRGFSYVLWSGWRGAWLAFRSLIFTASLNPWPSVIAFKAVKPQHPSLSFIIYVCGLRGGKKKNKVNAKKKPPPRNSDRLGFGIGRTDQARERTLFSLIYSQLLLPCLFVFFIAPLFFS